MKAFVTLCKYVSSEILSYSLFKSMLQIGVLQLTSNMHKITDMQLS